MRIFAGPNGSGKTTLQRALAAEINLYHLVSPDDIFESLRKSPVLDLSTFDIGVTSTQLRKFLEKSTYGPAVRVDGKFLRYLGERYFGF